MYAIYHFSLNVQDDVIVFESDIIECMNGSFNSNCIAKLLSKHTQSKTLIKLCQGQDDIMPQHDHMLHLILKHIILLDRCNMYFKHLHDSCIFYMHFFKHCYI